MLPTPLKKHDMIIASKIAYIESPETVALFRAEKGEPNELRRAD